MGNVIGSKIVGTRIAWVNMLERKDFLIKKGNRCLSADDIGIRLIISLGVGALLLMLRIALFGLPYMSEGMLKSTSLIIAGIVMYWPLYILATLAALICYGFIQKKKIEKELKEVTKQIEAYRLCW